MKAYFLLIVCCCISLAALAQDSATITIKLIKENFKEDTLLYPVLSKITLQSAYRSTEITNIEIGKDIQRVNDSVIIIPNLRPGIYFFRPYTKNTRLQIPFYVQRLVVCTKCDATLKLSIYYLRPGDQAEDEDRIFTESNSPDYSKVYWKINEGFKNFLQSSYLDSIQKDFFAVLKRKEKKKISGQPFTIQAFITAKKQIADITVLPETLAPELKKIIARGFANIQFDKQNAPEHINWIKYAHFKGEKITMQSSELFN